MRKTVRRWQATAYGSDGTIVCDWGAVTSLLAAAGMAAALRREFPGLIVAIVPARY